MIPIKKDEKLTTYVIAVIDEDVINKAYLNEKLLKKPSLIIIRKRLQRF